MGKAQIPQLIQIRKGIIDNARYNIHLLLTIAGGCDTAMVQPAGVRNAVETDEGIKWPLTAAKPSTDTPHSPSTKTKHHKEREGRRVSSPRTSEVPEDGAE